MVMYLLAHLITPLNQGLIGKRLSPMLLNKCFQGSFIFWIRNNCVFHIKIRINFKDIFGILKLVLLSNDPKRVRKITKIAKNFSFFSRSCRGCLMYEFLQGSIVFILYPSMRMVNALKQQQTI